MKAYIVVSLVTILLGFLMRLSFMVWAPYPRMVEHSRGTDAFAMLIGLCAAAWAAYLLL